MAIKGLVYFFYSPFQGMIYWLYRLLSAGKGADMNYYNASGQMDLSDRIAIETGICIGESFKKIAKRLRRHPSTIAHEVKENRTFIKGNYPNGKDCRMARQCTVRNLCGCDEEACNTKCRLCRGVDCTKVCDRYVSVACHKFDSPPYVCNNCKDKKLCNKDKYIYSAKFADVAVTRRRSESRQGVRLSDEKKEELDELVTRLVKKGQPLTHIYAEHEDGFLVYRTSLYYCDPMASWQKGCIEKNHEFIRYAVPKGKSLNPYAQEDMTLLMNHINSVKRPGLGNKSPYELVEEDDEDFKALMSLLKMHLIPPDEVHLMPDLFVKK